MSGLAGFCREEFGKLRKCQAGMDTAGEGLVKLEKAGSGWVLSGGFGRVSQSWVRLGSALPG